MQPPACDIVIPVWNQPELTARCLQSLERCRETRARLILVDNGSDAPTQELLERARARRPDSIRVLRNERNLGFIRATNQGIRAGDSDWVCLLNNDTVVAPGWLSEMIQVAQADPRIGLVNPTSNSLGFPLSAPSVDEQAKTLRDQRGRWAELSTALGFCLLARRSLLNQVGLLDESFGMGNFDDDDLSRRVRQAGFLCVRSRGAYVYHEEKASFRRLPGWEDAFDENRRRFESRWGKRIRILWGPLRPLAPAAAPEGLIRELVGQGHWISFLGLPEAGAGELSALAQVSFLKVHPRFWRLQATLKLLAKRKKPYRLVVSFDPGWSRWLRGLRWMGFGLLESPSENQIGEACQKLSQSRSGPR
ncbi:MAG: glycosyltransferase family 2 protein [Candidatus Omnitrophica bacterium]|nr:glycosyltransferase family 2 protein [Candidatus Omnitrophota bacterium]